jgi:hypothetical protein
MGLTEQIAQERKPFGRAQKYWSTRYAERSSKEAVPFSMYPEDAMLPSHVSKQIGLPGLDLDPRRVQLPPRELLPNFGKEVETFQVRSPEYGKLNGGGDMLTARVYLSNDGTARYVFVEDSQGRTALATVEKADAKLNEYGVRREYFDLSGMDAPLMEYHAQTPDKYGGSSGEGRQGSYMLNWNYVRDQPIVQLYYRQTKREMPRALEPHEQFIAAPPQETR